MIKMAVKIIVSALAVFIAAYLVPGVAVDSFLTAALVAIVLGILNTVIKPVLVVLTLPINIVTLGMFTLAINVFIVMLASSFVSGFQIDSFLSALFFSVALSLVSSILNSLIE